MAKVEAPNKDYNGPGPGDATFENGVAEVEDEAALNYYRGAGYKVSGKVDNPVESPEPPDPREVTDVEMGTRLRDAAVDPRAEDFLAPTNAGEGNPHGSTVIAPEIHASGPQGIRPGQVFVEDIAKQDEREKAFAVARLVEQKSARAAIAAEVEDLDDRGEIGISDPGSAEVGRKLASEDAPSSNAALLEESTDAAGNPVEDDATDEATTSAEAPAKSDNKAAWVDHAVSQGADRGEAESMTKANLVNQYGA